MKIQECLSGLVGLRGVCESEDVSVYINDLPGIEFRSFSNLATQDDVQGSTLFQRLHDRAAKLVANDFISHLNARKNIKLLEVISEHERGSFHNTDFYEMADLFVGKEIYANSGGGTIKRRLDWVEVKVKQDAVKTLYVLSDGVPYHIEKLILQKGINRVPINIKGDVIRFWLSICDVELAMQYSGGKCGCNYDCECPAFDCGYEKSIQLEENGDWETTNIDPFRYHVSCVCDRNDIICTNSSLFDEALAYKIGFLLMKEAIYSRDKSYFVRNSKETAREWIATVMGGENPETGFTEKGEYWPMMANATNSIINTLKDSPCVQCDGLSIGDSIP